MAVFNEYCCTKFQLFSSVTSMMGFLFEDRSMYFLLLLCLLLLLHRQSFCNLTDWERERMRHVSVWFFIFHFITTIAFYIFNLMYDCLVFLISWESHFTILLAVPQWRRAHTHSLTLTWAYCVFVWLACLVGCLFDSVHFRHTIRFVRSHSSVWLFVWLSFVCEMQQSYLDDWSAFQMSVGRWYVGKFHEMISRCESNTNNNNINKNAWAYVIIMCLNSSILYWKMYGSCRAVKERFKNGGRSVGFSNTRVSEWNWHQ